MLLRIALICELCASALAANTKDAEARCAIDKLNNTYELLSYLSRLEAKNKCVHLDGDLKITKLDFHPTFLKPLRYIKTVNGSIEIKNNNISFLMFDALEEITPKGGRALTVVNNARLLDLEFPKLRKVKGRILITRNPVLWTKWFHSGRKGVERFMKRGSTMKLKPFGPNRGSFKDYLVLVVLLGVPFITVLGYVVIWLVSQTRTEYRSRPTPLKSAKSAEHYDN
ncbi:hypothetical protein Q1695_005947 [Nippostrongylus brasiliensis]|nr:hypothetical protein Q1695_005947 [Nippostrongylus brasiliensis]